MIQILRNIAACLLCIMVYTYKGEARTVRHKRSLQQLAYQLKYHYGEDSATALLNYGCDCGRSGKGDPKDGVDQCCKDHNDCYGREYDCWPENMTYEYELLNKTVNCQDRPNSCTRSVCDCDKTFVDCLYNKEFNPKYYNVDQNKHCYFKKKC